MWRARKGGVRARALAARLVSSSGRGTGSGAGLPGDPSRAARHIPRLPRPGSGPGPGLLSPLSGLSVAIAPPTAKGLTGRSVLDPRPFPSAPRSRAAGELTEGKGAAGAPRTWAEGGGQTGVAAGMHQGGARELGGGRWGEGQVPGRDLAGAVPSEGCRASPSRPRKALLVSSSSAHSGDLGPGLDSGGCGAEGPRGTVPGPRMSAMLKGVRAARGSGPALMAGRTAGLRRSCRPRCSAPQLPGPQRAAPDLGPRLGPASHAGPEPRVPLLLRPHCLTPGRRGSGAARRPGSGISSAGSGGAQRSRRSNSPELPPWLLRAAGAALRSLWLDPSWAAPSRLAAAAAHKLS